MKLAVGLLVIALVFLGREWLSLRSELADLRAHPVLLVDTVRLPVIPEAVEHDLETTRTPARSLKEKLTGVKVIQPEEGAGPVVIYEQPTPRDTAIAAVKVKQGALDLIIRAPASDNTDLLIDLPNKDISRCQSFTIGANGLVRCRRPPLGVLNFEAEADLSTTLDFDSRIGVAWKRDNASTLSLRLYTKPEGKWRVYAGVNYRKNLFGM